MVGDCKKIVLNGTVGTLALSNYETYVYIIGFNHNGATNTIDFGTFKTAASGGKDIALIDANYIKTSTDGTKWFSMNHSSNTNYGGWKNCDLRYDILGSTHAKGADANATTITNPVANTLMAALPAELRAILKPMTIYTDNTGDPNIVIAVTASVDYLPLLAEWEIQGARTAAHSAEQQYQSQYSYYSAGNSKVKYRHSATSSTAVWNTRSTCVISANTTSFCVVNVSGNQQSASSGASRGIAPIFRV